MSKYVITKDGEVFDIHEYWLSKAFEIEPNEDYWVDEMLRKKGIDKKDCKVVSTIEKELKALEIIDKKGLSTNELWFIKNGKSFENYTETMKELYWGDETIEKELKTEDEFKLLREVFYE